MGLLTELPENNRYSEMKPRRYSTTSTPPQQQQRMLPGQLVTVSGHGKVISNLSDVSTTKAAAPTVSIVNVNVMSVPGFTNQGTTNISPSKANPKSGRSISVSDPLSMTELTTKSNSSQSRSQRGSSTSSYHSTHAATKFKTEMCRPFTENGHCKYGNKCQFAHGEEEMRAVPRHPKFKTEMCRTFHTNGFCPYGPRCHFIHNEDEHKLEEISHQKQQAAAQQAAQQVLVEMAKIQNQKSALDAQLSSILQHIHLANLVSLQQPGDSSVPPTPGLDNIQFWSGSNTTPNTQASYGQQYGSSGDRSPSGSNSTSSPLLSPTFSLENDADFPDFLSNSTPSGDESNPNNHFVFPTPESSPPHMSPVKEKMNTNCNPADLGLLAGLLQGVNLSGNPALYGMASGSGLYT